MRPPRRKSILRIAIAAFLVAGFAADSWGQPGVVATPTTAATEEPVAPGEVSLAHSRVFIHVGKVGLGHEHAVVGRIKKGTIHLGADRSAGVLVFDMLSLEADTTEARRYVGLEGETSASTAEQVNANMRGKDVLHVDKYPVATFIIDSALPAPAPAAGESQFELTGKLTLHGVNRPLSIQARLVDEQHGYQHIRAGFTLKQTEFGIKPFSKALGAVGVADELKVFGDAWLRKDVAAAPQQ